MRIDGPEDGDGSAALYVHDDRLKLIFPKGRAFGPETI